MDDGTREALFEIIELEDSTIKYFIDDKKSPAICIASGFYSSQAKFTLYFGRGIKTEYFKKKNMAMQRAIQILRGSTKPITVRIKEEGKKDKILSWEELQKDLEIQGVN